MALDRLKNTALPHALSDVVGDLAELVQKELRLARAEVSQKISAKLQAGAWMGTAVGLGLITTIVAVQALVFGIASYGIALHWSCLIVAGLLAVVAAAAFAKGHADDQEGLAPTRTIENIKEDIATAKEQLS